MKTRAIFFGMAIVLLSFSSCQKIKDSLTVKVPVEFTSDMQVQASELKSSALFYNFQATATLNPSTNATVIKYKQKIKSITANGMSYTPTGLTGDVKIWAAVLQIAGSNSAGNPIIINWNINNVTLKNGVKVTLPNPVTGAFSDISTLLDGTSDINIVWSGTQNVPVIKYTFTTTLEAEVLAYLIK